MKNKDLKQVGLIIAMMLVGLLLLGLMGAIATNALNFWLGAIIGFIVVIVLVILAMAYNKCRY